MKFTDRQLLDYLWYRQVKGLSTGLITHHFGKQYSVESGEADGHIFAQQDQLASFMLRDVSKHFDVTNQTVRRRVNALPQVKLGYCNTFILGHDCRKQMIQDAKDFLVSSGIGLGFKNATPMTDIKIKAIKTEAEKRLTDKYCHPEIVDGIKIPRKDYK